MNKLLTVLMLLLVGPFIGVVSAQQPLPKAKPKTKEPVMIDPSAKAVKPAQSAIKLESIQPQDTGTREFYSEDGNIQIKPEQQPEFPGGQKGLNMFITEHLIYPPEAKANKAEGIFIVKFTIETDGRVLDPVVISDPVKFGAKEEVYRLISLMPRWQPAKLEGNPVPVHYTMPISFYLK